MGRTEDICEALGFRRVARTITPFNLELVHWEGAWDGVSLQLNPPLNAQEEKPWYVSAHHATPLRCGLLITTEKDKTDDLDIESEARDNLRGAPFVIDTLNAPWRLEAREDERARAIAEAVAATLQRHLQAGREVSVSDDCATVVLAAGPSRAQVEETCSVAVAILREVEAARDDAPLSDWEDELVRGWSALAKRLRCTFDSDTLQLAGETHGVTFAAAIGYERLHGPRTTVELRMARGVSSALSLMRGPADALAGAVESFFGLKAFTTGDERFDARFAAMGDDESALHLLTSDTRPLLLELPKSVFQVRARGRGVELTADTAMSAGDIERTLSLMKRLGPALRDVPPRQMTVRAGGGFSQEQWIAGIVVVLLALAFLFLR